jgi:hypothetical protein
MQDLVAIQTIHNLIPRIDHGSARTIVYSGKKSPSLSISSSHRRMSGVGVGMEQETLKGQT